MATEDFYREPPNPGKWYQGDIIRDVPHLTLVPPFHVLRFQQKKGGGQTAVPYAYDLNLSPDAQSTVPNDKFKLHTQGGDAVSARAQLAPGMLVSEDCEIDKPARSKYLLVAPIRPVSALPSEDIKEIIRSGLEDRAFYLPPGPNVEEAYVDLRRITPISSDLLDQQRRITCLSENARAEFQFQLILFMTGREFRSPWDVLRHLIWILTMTGVRAIRIRLQALLESISNR